MRKSRVLLAGVAVVAAGVTTSAFTASNTVPSSTAGYASATVSGATATKITYVLDPTDKALADAVNFEITENITGMQAYVTLRSGGASGAVVGSPVQCTVGTRTTISPVSCPLNDRHLTDFDSLGLTIAQ
ncbi:hypothetical protein DQ237_17130 [Blastococcus sp. TF02-8]|uniref:hypothetical protein n=1 Tax=Blastococcus sp. TF02-8 TaxID=2250574 RepID=UPI000DE849FE|nr:hypothetical protein [Blastococcus sp. TF02-8]RBY93690.1 hypothetical protein DQ237_17130 [Blastococcus sp. TF02-8]